MPGSDYFIVTWESFLQEDEEDPKVGYGVYAQIYKGTTTPEPIGDEFQVNIGNDAEQSHAKIIPIPPSASIKYGHRLAVPACARLLRTACLLAVRCDTCPMASRSKAKIM